MKSLLKSLKKLKNPLSKKDVEVLCYLTIQVSLGLVIPYLINFPEITPFLIIGFIYFGKKLKKAVIN